MPGDKTIVCLNPNSNRYVPTQSFNFRRGWGRRSSASSATARVLKSGICFRILKLVYCIKDVLSVVTFEIYRVESRKRPCTQNAANELVLPATSFCTLKNAAQPLASGETGWY